MSRFALRVNDLGKEYRLGPQERYRTLRDTLTEWLRSPILHKSNTRRPPFWALKNVTFDVQPGEIVGVIGRNGAGKSTLLKLLSRITEPTEGRLEIQGRVGSLLEVGTGFHPELTGRENVLLNGAILGMSRRDVERQFDDIVSFSGVEEFINTPVKRYSSGMYTRLAFAVAAHLDTEILLVDEVLAVGDAAFQKKSLGKMNDVARGGRTVLFVSHNLSAVQRLCNRSLLLSHGRLERDGPTSAVIEAYVTDETQPNEERLVACSDDGAVTLAAVDFACDGAASVTSVLSGSDIAIVLRVLTRRRLIDCRVFIGIDARDGTRVSMLGSQLVGSHLTLEPGFSDVYCYVRRLPLVAGRYGLAIELIDQNGPVLTKYVGVTMRVEDGHFHRNGTTLSGSWMGPVLIDHYFECHASAHAMDSSGDRTPIMSAK